MYSCSICGKEVVVDHINKPSCCPGAKIYAGIAGTARGESSMNGVVSNNNFSEEMGKLIVQLMTVVIAKELIQLNKDHLFANDVVISDASSGRKFKFTITAKEC